MENRGKFRITSLDNTINHTEEADRLQVTEDGVRKTEGGAKIIFSDHAEMKFDILERHGFRISKDLVISAMESPDKIEEGYKGRRIAQKAIDEEYLIRVVYKDFHEELRVITFYPGRRERYEN